MYCILNPHVARPRLHSQRPPYGCAGLSKSDRTGLLVYNDPPSRAIKNADDRYGEAERLGTGPTSSTSEGTSILNVLIVSRSLFVSLILVYTPDMQQAEVRTRAQQDRTGLSRSIAALYLEIMRSEPLRRVAPQEGPQVVGFKFTLQSVASQAIPSVQRDSDATRAQGLSSPPIIRDRAGAIRPDFSVCVEGSLLLSSWGRHELLYVRSLSFSFTLGKRKGSWGPPLRLTGKTVCGNLRLCYPYSAGTCQVTSPFGPHRTSQPKHVTV